MNPAAAQLLGWTQDEIRGRSMHEILHSQRGDGTELPSFECPILGVLTTGRPVRVTDDVFTCRDGTVLPVAYSAARRRTVERRAPPSHDRTQRRSHAPGRLLPVAERYGLITEIDRWVIAQAVRLAAKGDRTIEANLSAASIEASDLVPFIEHQIQEAGADPANLVFEITETALMTDITAGMEFARGLREIGCGLALDDFGTGYGSFT